MCLRVVSFGDFVGRVLDLVYFYLLQFIQDFMSFSSFWIFVISETFSCLSIYLCIYHLVWFFITQVWGGDIAYHIIKFLFGPL